MQYSIINYIHYAVHHTVQVDLSNLYLNFHGEKISENQDQAALGSQHPPQERKYCTWQRSGDGIRWPCLSWRREKRWKDGKQAPDELMNCNFNAEEAGCGLPSAPEALPSNPGPEDAQAAGGNESGVLLPVQAVGLLRLLWADSVEAEEVRTAFQEPQPQNSTEPLGPRRPPRRRAAAAAGNPEQEPLTRMRTVHRARKRERRSEWAWESYDGLASLSLSVPAAGRAQMCPCPRGTQPWLTRPQPLWSLAPAGDRQWVGPARTLLESLTTAAEEAVPGTGNLVRHWVWSHWRWGRESLPGCRRSVLGPWAALREALLDWNCWILGHRRACVAKLEMGLPRGLASSRLYPSLWASLLQHTSRTRVSGGPAMGPAPPYRHHHPVPGCRPLREPHLAAGYPPGTRQPAEEKERRPCPASPLLTAWLLV